MPDAAPSTFALTIVTGSYADIFLLNSRLELLEQAMGRLETRQPPGVYKVKIRQGRDTHEELVLLDKDLSRTIAAPEFATAVPILQTKRSHEFHHEVARKYGHQTDVTLGDGPTDASIFVLVRYWTGEGETGRRFAPPAKGFSLRTFDGGAAVDLGERSRVGDGPSWDPSAACTVAVRAGPYVLRAETSEGMVIEQVVFASPGWQTQVFVLRQPVARERAAHQSTLRPDDVSGVELFDLSVLMGRGSLGDDAQLRLTELARIALADERPTLPRELKEILSAKFENPMLGILGAHLLLLGGERTEQDAQRLTRRPDRRAVTQHSESISFNPSLFDHVVDTLRGLLGRTHTDVEALSLRCAHQNLRTDNVCRTPPMLRRSWSLLIQASADRPGLLPVETWRRVARMTPSRPFLSWMADLPEQFVEDLILSDLRGRIGMLRRGGRGALRSAVTRDPAPESALAPNAEVSIDLRKKLSVELEMPMSAVDWAFKSFPDTRAER